MYNKIPSLNGECTMKKNRFRALSADDGSFEARVGECIRRLEENTKGLSLSTLDVLDPGLPRVRVTSDQNCQLFVFFDLNTWILPGGWQRVFSPTLLEETKIGVIRADEFVYPKIKDYNDAKKLFREIFRSVLEEHDEESLLRSRLARA